MIEKSATISPLDEGRLNEAIDLVFKTGLDTREEVEHHLRDLGAYYIALDQSDKIIGVIGWYQDNVNYANEAMGKNFPAPKLIGWVFSRLKKNIAARG